MFACMHVLDNSMHNLGKRSCNFPMANDLPSSMPVKVGNFLSVMLLGIKNTFCSHTYYSASIGKFNLLVQTLSPTWKSTITWTSLALSLSLYLIIVQYLLLAGRYPRPAFILYGFWNFCFFFKWYFQYVISSFTLQVKSDANIDLLARDRQFRSGWTDQEKQYVVFLPSLLLHLSNAHVGPVEVFALKT